MEKKLVTSFFPLPTMFSAPPKIIFNKTLTSFLLSANAFSLDQSLKLCLLEELKEFADDKFRTSDQEYKTL